MARLRGEKRMFHCQHSIMNWSGAWTQVGGYQQPPQHAVCKGMAGNGMQEQANSNASAADWIALQCGERSPEGAVKVLEKR